MTSNLTRSWTVFLVCGLAVAATAQEPVPLDFARSHWIWSSPGMPRAGELAFRKTFELTSPRVARLAITADAAYEVTVNGAVVGRDGQWAEPEQYDVSPLLRSGRNVIAVRVTAGPQHPGLLVAFRCMATGGELLELVSDASWRLAPTPADGWTTPEFADASWSAASDLGLYGAAPWGRLTRISAAETQRALDEVRVSVPDETAEHPTASTFAGQYAAPEYAERYESYFTIDRTTGRFRLGDQDLALLCVRYRQPGAAGPAEFDFDLFEADLKLLAANHLTVGLGGFGWADLLAADGTWKRVAKQPRGKGLREFQYAFEVLDHVLDRVQAHGLHAVALLDYRTALPAELLPELYRDKVLVASALWQGVVAGQQKIARRFAQRPVLVGYALATDALPSLPGAAEPLVADLYHSYLEQRHGDLEGLRRAWGPGATWPSFAAVPPPGEAATDPGAVDFHGMQQWITIKRLNEWVDALRAADPHHLFAVGLADPVRPLFLASWLRFDLLGTFGLAPADAGRPAAMPGFGTAVGAVSGYRDLPGSTIAAVLGGRLGGGLRGGQATRLVRHEWAECVGSGAAGLIAAPSWDALLGRGGTGLADSVGVQQLGELVAATQGAFRPTQPAVALLRNPAVAYSNDPAADGRSAQRVAEALDRLHIDYTILSPGAFGGPDEKGKVELDQFQVVIVPGLRQLPRDRFFDQLQDWLEDSSASGRRAAVLGAWVPQSEYFQGQTPPAELLRLTGGVSLLPGAPPAAGQSLVLDRPLAGSAASRRLTWPESAASSRVAVATGQTAAVVGWLRGSTPTSGGQPLVVRQEVNGNPVVVTGFDLGFGDLAADDPALVDVAAAVLEPVLAAADVSGGYQADPNVTVRFTADGRRAVLRERLGTSSDRGWSAVASRPPLAWSGATTVYDGRGLVQVKASLAPYQIKVLDAVAELRGLAAGQAATVKLGAGGGAPFTLAATGPESLSLRLHLLPEREYLVQAGQEPAERLTAGPDGTLDLAGRSGPCQVTLLPPRQPDTAREPAAFLVVGDYYQQRGEFARALNEFERLEQQYAGSPIATLAGQRRAALLADCGAVALVNYSRMPLRVRYVGPSLVEGDVPPGQTRTWVLYQGAYQELKQVPDGIWAAAVTKDTAPVAVTVAKGQVTVREFGVYLAGQGTTLDPQGNLRLALTDPEKQALTASAQALLPAPAAPGAAGGAGGPAGAEGEAAAATQLNFNVEVKEVVQKEPKQPTPFAIRNLSPHELTILVTRFVVGVAPERGSFKLRPRGRLNLEFNGGTYDIIGKVAATGQLFAFTDKPVEANGNHYQAIIKELTPEQAKRLEEAKAGGGIVAR